MRIAYNGLFLARPFSGTGQYTAQFLRSIVHAMPKDEHIVYTPEPPKVELPKRLEVEIVPPTGQQLINRLVGYDYWERHDICVVAKRDKVDLYHALYPTARIKLDVPVVMTVHDMITWKLPQYRRRLRSRVRLGQVLGGIKAADRVVAVSETTKQDIVEIGGIPPEKVTVTYEGLGKIYDKKTGSRKVEEVKQKHGLVDRPYLFYIGGYDYRKNVRALIAAFGESGLADTHDLVMAGAVTAPRTKLYEDFARLPQLIKQAGLTQQVKILGFISEEEKKALMCGSASFVYPSLAEGFGLPVLEALCMGVPVAASQIPSTVELFGPAVELFDPTDRKSMVTAMRRTVEHPDGARQKKGYALAKRYTWADTAKRTAALYRKLAP